MSTSAKSSVDEVVEECVREFFRQNLSKVDGSTGCLNGHCDFLGADAGYIGILKREGERFILRYECICCFGLPDGPGEFEAELGDDYIAQFRLKAKVRDGEEVFWHNSDAAKRDYPYVCWTE
jgi:hypothetical protein